MSKFAAGMFGSLGQQMEEGRKADLSLRNQTSLEELRGRINADLELARQKHAEGLQKDRLDTEASWREADRIQAGEKMAYDAARTDAQNKSREEAEQRRHTEAMAKADRQYQLDRQRLGVELTKAQKEAAKGGTVDFKDVHKAIDDATKSLDERIAGETDEKEKARLTQERAALTTLRTSSILGAVGIKPRAGEGQPAPGESKVKIEPPAAKPGAAKREPSLSELEANIGPQTPQSELVALTSRGSEKARLELRRRTDQSSWAGGMLPAPGSR